MTENHDVENSLVGLARPVIASFLSTFAACQLLTAMNLFQYQEVSLLRIIIFVIVLAAERASAALREHLS